MRSESEHKTRNLVKWTWISATFASLVLSVIGLVVTVVLSFLLFRRAEKGHAIAAVAVSLLIVACVYLAVLKSGSEGEQTRDPRSAVTAPLDPPTSSEGGDETIAADLFDRWRPQIEKALLASRERSNLYLSGSVEESIRVGQRAKRLFRPMLSFGREARKAFLGSDPNSPLVKATVAAGDAWAIYALRVSQTLPEGGTFEQGRQLADLGAKAIRIQQTADAALSRKVAD